MTFGMAKAILFIWLYAHVSQISQCCCTVFGAHEPPLEQFGVLTRDIYVARCVEFKFVLARRLADSAAPTSPTVSAPSNFPSASFLLPV